MFRAPIGDAGSLAAEKILRKRTLTNLYNARPTWLAQAHPTLDRALWSAYDWSEDPADTDYETILRRLLALIVG